MAHHWHPDGDGECTECPMPKAHPVHLAEIEEVHVYGSEEPIRTFAYAEPTSLPYDGSSGHSGSETSHDRARERDTTGITGRLQRALLALVSDAGANGLTIAEARQEFTGDHHGSLSGALSNLHKDGRIERLTDRRSRCEVYVLPEYVNGRETVAQGRKRTSRLTADDTNLLNRVASYRDQSLTLNPDSRLGTMLGDLIDLVRRLDGTEGTS